MAHPFHAHLCQRGVAARTLGTLWPRMVMVRATWWRLCTTWGWGRSQQFLSSALIPSSLLSQPCMSRDSNFSCYYSVPKLVCQVCGSLVKTFVYWARKEALGKDIREATAGLGEFPPKMCQLKFIGHKIYSISSASLDPLTICSTRNHYRTNYLQTSSSTLSSGTSPTLPRQAFTS